MLLTIDSATDPDIAILVPSSTISGEIIARIGVEIGFHKAMVIVVDSASHGGPGLLDGQDASNIVAFQLFSSSRIQDGSSNAKEGERSRARLGRRSARQWAHYNRASFSLPISVHNSTLRVPDLFIVPFPSFWIDGLAY